MQHADLARLRENISGNVILPGDSAYEMARTTLVVKDAHPAVVVQAASTADIAAAIAFAKAADVPLSVRSGGHHAAGFGTNNGGVVIDLSLLNAITVLDKKAGLVQLGAGALWGDVAAALTPHSLALSSGDTKTVAVGGLTLGGGIGWMVRQDGYAIDHLVAAEVVLANGSVVHASESEHSDLFWAIRGGGGNFGIVSSFTFKAHRQGKIVESTLLYKTDNLQHTIAGWRDHMRKSPQALTSFLSILPAGFMGPDSQVMIMNCFANDNAAQAKAAIEPLRHLGTLISGNSNVKSYADILQDAHPPEGIKIIVKNMFAKVFSNDLIGALSALYADADGPSAIVQLRAVSGAADTIDRQATAMAHRGNEVFLFVGFPLPIMASSQQEARCRQAWEKLAPYSSGAYSNFLSDTNEPVTHIYPPATYRRLAAIKHTYDPENIFRHNFNIPPSG